MTATIKHRYTLSLLTLVLLAARAQAATTFYVAPSGNDAWSGTRAQATGDNDGPWATLSRAAAAIRDLKAGDGLPDGGVVVEIAAGTYYLPSPWTLGADDSGTDLAPIVYRGAGDTRPVLSGGQPVRDWQPYRGQVYRADLKAEGIDAAGAEQLFYRDQLQTCARTPNVDPADPRYTGWAFTTADASKETADLLHYDPAVLDPTGWTRPRDARVIMFSWPNYGNQILPVTDVRPDDHLLVLGGPGVTQSSRTGDRFFVENVFEMLDAPGEWYYHPEEGMLYFWPPDGRAPAAGDVVVPVLETVVQLHGEGDRQRRIRRVVLENLAIRHGRGHGIELRHAEACTVAGCDIRLVEQIGVQLHAVCRDNRIVSNDVTDTGYAGIRLIGEVFRHDRVRDNVIENNHVWNIARRHCMEAAGVYLIACGHNRIAHNLVHDTPRWGIGLNVGNDNIYEYNHVYRVNLETEDAGIFNSVTSWGNWDANMEPGNNDHIRGNIIRYNLLHGSGGYGRMEWFSKATGIPEGQWAHDWFTWGIYLDLASCGTHVYGNIVYDTFGGGVIIGGGSENVVENNIFVDGSFAQIYTVKWSERYPMANNRFERNIIAFSDPDAYVYHFTQQYQEPWVPYNVSSDHNLVWQEQGDPLTVLVKWQDRPQTWAWWLEQGMDRRSITADPCFVDAAARDYRLQPGSPAWTMGFERIPVESIGLYRDAYRQELPAANDAR